MLQIPIVATAIPPPRLGPDLVVVAAPCRICGAGFLLNVAVPHPFRNFAYRVVQEVVQVNCRPSARYRLTLQWPEILHQWNVRVNIFMDRANIKTWSHICCLSYWRLAQHIATLPPERGSTNFTMVPTWNISKWSPTLSLGVKT